MATVAARDGIFEDQIPADDPGDQFAHGGVGISVGAAGHRNHGGELRVTKTGKSAADAGDNKREHDRWTRAIGNGRGGAHEQTGADDSADAERDQVHRSERTLQAVFADFLRFCHQLVERLSRE